MPAPAAAVADDDDRSNLQSRRPGRLVHQLPQAWGDCEGENKQKDAIRKTDNNIDKTSLSLSSSHVSLEHFLVIA